MYEKTLKHTGMEEQRAQPMEAKFVLAKNLKRFRMENNISQEEIADMANLSVRGYGKIERCEVNASLDTLDKLVDGTGLSRAQLLTDADLLTAQ